MPEFLTFSKLRHLQESIYFSESKMRMMASKEGKNVFLSYSSKDKGYLSGIIKLLEDHGGAVYVDEGDSRLPHKPSKVTAEILKDTIQKVNRLVVFVTVNSKDSKWIPWELGLGDAYKTPSSVALLPTSESEYQQEWTEQEYLGLYRRIVWGRIEGERESCWIVYDHVENSAQKLRSWIKG